MNCEKIGMKLIELRGKKTQMSVANKLGISVSALSMYEQGKRIPRDEVKLKLARFYGTTVENIFFTA